MWYVWCQAAAVAVADAWQLSKFFLNSRHVYAQCTDTDKNIYILIMHSVEERKDMEEESGGWARKRRRKKNWNVICTSRLAENCCQHTVEQYTGHVNVRAMNVSTQSERAFMKGCHKPTNLDFDSRHVHFFFFFRFHSSAHFFVSVFGLVCSWSNRSFLWSLRFGI